MPTVNDSRRKRVVRKVNGASRTKTSEREVTDINTMMNRYIHTGQLPTFQGRVPVYGDFSAMSDLQGMLDGVREAQERFERLPSAVRAVAGHDPVRFLELLASPDGTQALIDAGLDAEIYRVDDNGDRIEDYVEGTPPDSEASSSPKPSEAKPRTSSDEAS